MRSRYVVGLFLLVVTFAAFHQVLGHQFTNYDDTTYVTHNPHIRHGLSVQGLAWAFKSGYAANWHPLTWLSHMLDIELYDLRPAGHHMSSLLLHMMNVLLLFLVFDRMTKCMWKSAFVAALFALHPLHVESVAWVAERKDVLSTTFWLLAMGAYVRYAEARSPGRYLPVVVLFLLGLMSKPMLVTLPFVLVLLDYWPLGVMPEGRASRPTLPQLALEKIPLLVLAVGSSIATYMVQQREGAMSYLFPFGTRLANAVIAYVVYTWKTIWPVKLAVFYPHLHKLIPAWQVAGAFLVLLVITVLVLAAGRSRRYLLVGWLWYLGTLVPVIGLVQVGAQAMADRYTYVPLIGLFIIVAWGIPDSLKWQRSVVSRQLPGTLDLQRSMPSAQTTPDTRHTSPLDHALRILAVVSLVSLAMLTHRQVGYWKDSITLFRHALDVTVDNVIAHQNLGVAYAAEGRLTDAIEEYERVLRIDPDNSDAHYNLGNIYVRQRRLREAASEYEEAVRIEPRYLEARNNLGNVLAELGRLDDAIKQYEEVLRIDPRDATARRNLEMAQQRRVGDAGEMLTILALIKKDPDNAAARERLADLLVKEDRLDEAVEQYSEALRLNPRLAKAHLNLGALLSRRGDAESAMDHYRRALRIAPNYAEAHFNLANSLSAVGKTNEAIGHYMQAVRVKPDYFAAHYNLANLLLDSRHLDEAIAHYQAALRAKPDLVEARNNLALAFFYRGEYARAWEEIQQCRKYGGEPNPDFVRALTEKMTER